MGEQPGHSHPGGGRRSARAESRRRRRGPRLRPEVIRHRPQTPPVPNYSNGYAPCAAVYPRTSSSTASRPMPGSFIDTNVLVYLASGDPVKADKAERVLGEVGGVISVQVLNEFVNVARRKMRTVLAGDPRHAEVVARPPQGRAHHDPSPRHRPGHRRTPRPIDLGRHDRRLGAGGRLRNLVLGGYAGRDGVRGGAGGEPVLGGGLNEGGDCCCCPRIFRVARVPRCVN